MRVMVTALSFVQGRTGPGGSQRAGQEDVLFLSGGLAVNVSVPKANAPACSAAFFESSPARYQACARGCKLPPLQFFFLWPRFPEISNPGDPEVICVSVAVRATPAILEAGEACRPEQFSRRKRSPYGAGGSRAGEAGSSGIDHALA